MGTNTKLVYSIIFLALLVGGTYYLVKQNEAKGEQGSTAGEERVYLNQVYGYELVHDGALSLVEFTPEYQTLEDLSREEPNELVQIAVEEAMISDDYESFEDFAHEVSRKYCVADGPGGSMHCERVMRSESFTTATGFTGEVFYLEFIHETFASDGTATSRTVREAGPFYAFNISTDAPGSGYRALIMRPADFFSEGEMYDLGAAAAHKLVNSLHIY